MAIYHIYLYRLAGMLLCWSLSYNSGWSQAVPELMYYKFDVPGTSVINNGSAPVGNNPATVTGLTIGGIGQFGLGLNGTGGATASNRVDPGWTGSHTGSWTISFWMNVPSPSSTRYFFGNTSGNGTFRCFIGGVANTIRLAGGVPSVTLDMPNWVPGTSVITYVYDQSAGTVSGYINGVFQTSVSIGTSFPLVGTNFVVGSQGTSIDGIMDEFRMYNRALSQAEITATWNQALPLGPCTVPPTAGTAVASASSVCQGQLISLNVIGGSVGSGLTYQWQTSINAAGPWTNLGPAQSTAGLQHQMTMTGNNYFKCQVTCQTTSVFTDSVIVNVTPSPSGVFTINSAQPTGGANFQNFRDAISYISCGIGGPVTFNVVPGSGPYTDSLYIGDIAGTSFTNSIRINGNGASVNFASTATDRQIIRLVGTKHLRIDSLNFSTTGTTYSYGAIIQAGAQYDSITNCTFNLGSTTSTTSTNTSGICFSGSFTSATTTGNAKHCYIAGNTISGNTGAGSCYYALTLTGGADSNIIEDNKFENFYMYGAYINGGQYNLLRNNEFTRATKTAVTTFYGIYATGAIDGNICTQNQIHSPGGTTSSTSTPYGIYILGEASATHPMIISNNIVYRMNMGGIIYPININGAEHIHVYHNTFTVDQVQTGTSANYGIYLTGTNLGIKLFNNLASITQGTLGMKYGVFANTTASLPEEADGNIYYVNSAQSGNQYYAALGGQTFLTKQDLDAAATGYETHSIVADPQFANAAVGNLYPNNNALSNSGIYLGGLVDIDYLGNNRSLLPTSGAFEIPTPPGNNAGVLGLVGPAGALCANQHPIEVSIINYGTTQLSNFQVNWEINGVAQTPFTYTGTLDTSGGAGSFMDTITLGNVPLNLGANTVSAWTSVTADVNPANDTLEEVTITTIDFEVNVIGDTVCNGDTKTIQLIPNSGYTAGQIQWQSSANGSVYNNIPAAQQSLYTTPAMTADTWYRVFINSGNGGCYSDTVKLIVANPQILSSVADSICGPGSLQLIADAGNYSVKWYDAPTGGVALSTGDTFNTPSIVASTTYYAEPATSGVGGSVGPLDLNIGTYASWTATAQWVNFSVLSNTTINSVDVFFNAAINSPFTITIRDAVTAATVATYNGNTTISSTTTPMVVPIAASLSPGNYQINLTTNPGTYRNSTGAVYPYTLPGVLSITGNTFDQNYYYMFYNWNVGDIGCAGPRVAVNATVHQLPAVNLGADTAICATTPLMLDAGNAGATFLWDNNTTAQTRTVNTNGQYHVAVTNALGCTTIDTIEVTFKPDLIVSLGNDTTLCIGSSLVLDAGNVGSTYMWDNSTSAQTRTINAAGTYYVSVTNASACPGSDTIVVSSSPLPVVNLGNDTSICSPTPLVLNAGNAGATYLWDDNSTAQTRSVSSAGTYYVSVTNSLGCSATDTIQISLKPDVQVNLGNDTTLCVGSSMTLDAGNAGSSFVWDDNSTAQTRNISLAGTYSVTVSNATSCPGSDTIEVTSATLPIVNLGNDTALCVGASLTLDAGNVGADYLWDDNSTSQTRMVTAAGSYSVSVTNLAGCESADTINITAAPIPVVNLGNDTMICEGDALILDANNAGASYLWDDNSSNQQRTVTTAGQYFVSVTSADNCIGADTIVVSTVPLPSAASFTSTINSNGSVVFNATATGASVYNWNFGDGNLGTGNPANHTYGGNGTYTVILTLENDCGDTIQIQDQVTITNVGFREVLSDNSVLIYPNPADRIVTIENKGNQHMEMITLYDATGRNVRQLKPDNNQKVVLEVGELSAGIYNVVIQTKSGVMVSKLNIIR